MAVVTYIGRKIYEFKYFAEGNDAVDNTVIIRTLLQ